LAGWTLIANNPASATVAGDSLIAAEGHTAAAVHVTNAGPSPSYVSFEQGKLALTAGGTYQFSFWARSDSPRSITVFSQGGPPNYFNYGLNQQVSLTPTWQFFTILFSAAATASDGRVGFFVGDRAGYIWVDGVELIPAGADVYRRDFTNGAVVLNGTPKQQTIPLEGGFRKFIGSQAPLWQYIVDDGDKGFVADASWQTVTYDTGLTGTGSPNPPYYHAWNHTAHVQNGSSAAAQWPLNIPADGQYTLQVWLPAAPASSTWTKNAIYEVISNGTVLATSTLDQTVAVAGDAWHTVATVSLSAADSPILRVHNAGSGSLVADAVYVVSAALLNDGSVVNTVTLGPYDGILLQRQQPLPASASSVNAVVNGATFQPGIASAGFLSIVGTGLSGSTRAWASSDFAGTNLPTSLDGVSVTVNGKPTYLAYISPTQINAIAPDDDTIGPVTVQVTTPQGGASTGTALKQKEAPEFFAYQSGGTKYVAALHVDGTLVGPAGPSSRPAAPGEVIEIYGTGFGPANPAALTSQLVSQPAPLGLPA